MINRLATPTPSTKRKRRRTELGRAPHTDSAPGWTQKMALLIGDYPVASLAAALSLGVLVGWLIKRR